jgi:protein-S-isoprenylcysteine O-methyltransferase Ste14
MDRELLLAGYIAFFAFVHSLTAATSFKKKAYQFFEPGVYRFLYTVLSVLTTLPILFLWFIDRSSSILLYEIGFPYLLVSFGMFFSGATLILTSLFSIDLLGFIGLKHVLKLKAADTGLVTSGMYSVTRHPLYLGGMLILWSNPSMRLVDFAVALFFSLYFLTGAVLEERKLIDEFGEKYSNYKKEVSMFIPFKWILRKVKSFFPPS